MFSMFSKEGGDSVCVCVRAWVCLVGQGFEYSRSGNPTRNCLEKCIASLEGAKHGEGSLIFLFWWTVLCCAVLCCAVLCCIGVYSGSMVLHRHPSRNQHWQQIDGWILIWSGPPLPPHPSPLPSTWQLMVVLVEVFSMSKLRSVCIIHSAHIKEPLATRGLSLAKFCREKKLLSLGTRK